MGSSLGLLAGYFFFQSSPGIPPQNEAEIESLLQLPDQKLLEQKNELIQLAGKNGEKIINALIACIAVRAGKLEEEPLHTQLEQAETNQPKKQTETISVVATADTAVAPEEKLGEETDVVSPRPGRVIDPTSTPTNAATNTEKEYISGLDEKTRHRGDPSFFIMNLAKEPTKDYWSTTSFEAEKYIDRDLRVTGFIRTEKVTKNAHWRVRFEGVFKGNAKKMVVNQNFTGTNFWEKQEIRIKVPTWAKKGYVSLALDGPGKIWGAHFTAEPRPLEHGESSFELKFSLPK